MPVTTGASNIKVLHIASGDLWAGAEVQLFTLAKILNGKPGITVSVVLLNHGVLEKKLQETGINPVVLDESKLNSLLILYLLTRTIRQQKPDVIHTHRTKENILGSIAALLAGRIPSLRTVHGAPEHLPDSRQFPKYIIRSLDWFCGRFLQSQLISVSDELAGILRSDFPGNRIKTIENGVDMQLLQKHRKKTEGSSNSEPDKFFRIGLAGRLAPIKRVDLFIETAAFMQECHPEMKICFHIFGDGPLRGQMESLSQRLGTTDIVKFEGHVDDMYQYLSGMNALLLTSDHEGLPMILLEAMALEIPVVAHAVGGIPNVLDHGTCGILVDEHNPAGYARGIHKLVDPDETTRTLPGLAFNRVSTHYTAENNANSYLRTYKSVVKHD